VQQKSEKINEEKIKCQHMADLAQADLAEAMPALEEAVKVHTAPSPSRCCCRLLAASLISLFLKRYTAPKQ